MESIDRKMQQRVWQRVQQAAETVPEQTPEGLLWEELTDAAQLRALALPHPAQQAIARAEVLRGICRLSGLGELRQMPKAARPDNREAALRRCMLRLLQRYRAYRQLCAHEEYGILYEDLTQQTRAAATTLARSMGSTTNLLHNKKD